MTLVRRRHGTLGVKTLMVTLAQLSTAALLPVVDAHLEATSFDAPLHMDAQDADCAPTHDDVFCQVLRSLAHGTPTAGVSTIGLEGPFVEPSVPGASHAVVRTVRPGGLGSRAPPVP